MMRSLFTGVTGLRNHQTKMDVIGNNIANVNTVGFKASRVVFQDMFYQTMTGASTDDGTDYTAGAADAIYSTYGGKNPVQIGYGVRISAIDVLNTPSAMMNTSRTLDVFINGDGYLHTVNRMSTSIDGNDVIVASERDMYTRVGNLKFDLNGNLVDANGNFIQGISNDSLNALFFDALAADTVDDLNADSLENDFGADHNMSIPSDWKIGGAEFVPHTDETFDGSTAYAYGNIVVSPEILKNATNISIASNGVISCELFGKVVEIGQIAIAKFSNSEGLSQAGGSYYVQTANSGEPVIRAPGDKGAGDIVSGVLEMSNVDLSQEMTDMITTQRGFQANSRIITTSDEMLQELVNLKR